WTLSTINARRNTPHPSGTAPWATSRPAGDMTRILASIGSFANRAILNTHPRLGWASTTSRKFKSGKSRFDVEYFSRGAAAVAFLGPGSRDRECRKAGRHRASLRSAGSGERLEERGDRGADLRHGPIHAHSRPGHRTP